MNKVLLSAPTKKIIADLQELLIDHGILVITQPTQFNSHITHYMLVITDRDFAAAVRFIKTNYKRLRLPTELWEQFQQRLGNK